MTALLNDRERAEEYGFAHGEELRFLAAREGTAVVATWAAERLGGAGYEATLLDALVAGGIGAVAARVRNDLARAGRPETAAETDVMLERAVADAYARLHDAPSESVPAAAGAVPAAAHHKHGFWGWEV